MKLKLFWKYWRGLQRRKGEEEQPKIQCDGEVTGDHERITQEIKSHFEMLNIPQ